MTDRSTGAQGAGWKPAAWCRALFMAGLLAVGAPVSAKAIASGDIPVLAPDEGLLLLEVDTNLKLMHVQVSSVGRGSGLSLDNLRPGQTAGLFVVHAGDYRWSRIDTSLYTRLEFKDEDEYRFHVEPGKITYAGDLVFRPTSYYWANVQVRNRGLRAIDWLEATHPALARQLPVVYSGLYPDGFPAFYRAAQVASPHGLSGRVEVDAPPTPAVLPLSPRDLWRGDRVTHAALNPAGDLLAEALQLDETHWAIDLIDLKASSATRLVESPAEVRSLQWSGDRNLLGGVAETPGVEVVTVFHIRDGADGRRKFDGVRIDPIGNVLSTIPGDPDHVLYVSWLDVGAVVARIDISSRSSINSSRASRINNSLNEHVSNDVAWWADGHGRLRLVMTRKDDQSQLKYGAGDGRFAYMLALDSDTALEPVAMSFEGDLLYAISDEDRAQRDLVVFDPVQKRITRTLFSKPGVDVVSALFDDRQAPIGVTYYQEGRQVTEYFDARSEAMSKLLEKTFPGRTVGVVSRNHDGSQLVLEVEGSDQPPMLYHLDVARHQASLLESERPWLDGKSLAPSRLLKVASADGFPIEAYLTLPPGEGKHPLLVLPHGGPVGVSDRLLFDPEVQFYASLGYGVLRVNYRGSDGYGKAFREAGYGAQGTRIEDDIDAALKVALATNTLDPERMCIVGASYGGYSALVSVVRWPQRFRCAVSVAGISDRLLAFSATDGAQSAEGRKALERVFGDPRKQHDAMLEGSPLYHYRDLQVPIMLVHGEEDMRVDYEHSRRLVRMLNLAGRKPVMLSFKEGDHSYGEIDQIDKTYRGIAGFLEKFLGAPATASVAGSH